MDNDAGGWEPSQLRDFRAQIESAPALAAKVLGESGTAQRSLRGVKAGEFLRMDIKAREDAVETHLGRARARHDSRKARRGQDAPCLLAPG